MNKFLLFICLLMAGMNVVAVQAAKVEKADKADKETAELFFLMREDFEDEILNSQIERNKNFNGYVYTRRYSLNDDPVVIDYFLEIDGDKNIPEGGMFLIFYKGVSYTLTQRGIKASGVESEKKIKKNVKKWKTIF